MLAGAGESSRPKVRVLVRVTIDPDMKKKCPAVALGCLSAEIVAAPASESLQSQLRSCAARILALPEPKSALESPGILATRSAYKALGKDPARYRGSAEALLRRIIAGKELPRISNVVDIVNLLSVESRLSIGLYDLALVQGDVVFRTGRAGETYKGIGKYDLNLERLPVFSDAAGPHGSPTSDSERTMVTVATSRILAIIISFGGTPHLQNWIDRLSALLLEHAAARNIEARIVA